MLSWRNKIKDKQWYQLKIRREAKNKLMMSFIIIVFTILNLDKNHEVLYLTKQQI